MVAPGAEDSLFASPVRIRLALQLLATAAILAWLPGNAAKLFTMLFVWAIGFGRISRAELLTMIGVNLLFIGMNFGALRKGVFQFSSPDFLGMPVYEFFMWGFYTLHALRFLAGKTPGGKPWLAVLLAVAFAIPFSTVSDAGPLTLLTGIILVVSLMLFREPMDLV
jgi:hypothetical protein